MLSKMMFDNKFHELNYLQHKTVVHNKYCMFIPALPVYIEESVKSTFCPEE